MTAIRPGLSARDAQIMQLLHDGAPMQRIIAIGAHRGSWNAWQVGAVIGVCFGSGAPKASAVDPEETIQKRRRVAACGSVSGYTRHIRRKETVCQPCRKSRQEYVQARRQTRAEAAAEQSVELWNPEPFTGRATRVDLTPAQVDVLNQLCRGLSNGRIAIALRISEDTVKSHVKAIVAALGASDRTHAVVMIHTRQVRVTIRRLRRQAS